MSGQTLHSSTSFAVSPKSNEHVETWNIKLSQSSSGLSLGETWFGCLLRGASKVFCAAMTTMNHQLEHMGEEQRVCMVADGRLDAMVFLDEHGVKSEYADSWTWFMEPGMIHDSWHITGCEIVVIQVHFRPHNASSDHFRSPTQHLYGKSRSKNSEMSQCCWLLHLEMPRVAPVVWNLWLRGWKKLQVESYSATAAVPHLHLWTRETAMNKFATRCMQILAVYVGPHVYVNIYIYNIHNYTHMYLPSFTCPAMAPRRPATFWIPLPL